MNANGSAGSNLLVEFPAKTLPPAIVSFFTRAPSEKSRSASGTQKALGLVAESKNSTLFLWSQTVRQRVDEMFGLRRMGNSQWHADGAHDAQHAGYGLVLIASCWHGCDRVRVLFRGSVDEEGNAGKAISGPQSIDRPVITKPSSPT